MYATQAYLYTDKNYVLLYDNTLSPVYRWNPLFAKRLTINRGVDNVFAFQFLNQEQKPVDISNFVLTFNLISSDGTNLLISKTMKFVNPRLGTAQAIITAGDTLLFDAQEASWSVVRSGTSSVAAITITNPGYNYLSTPSVVITNSQGSNTIPATANAILTGVVDQIFVMNGGINYGLSGTPTVVISGGLANSGITANATAVANVNYGVFGAVLQSYGSGYSSATANITFDPPQSNGTMATATLIFDNANANITGINITSSGSGYTAPPNVYIMGPNTSAAFANTILAGSISSITVTNRGVGYISPPTVTIVDSYGSGAQAVSTVVNQVAQVVITNPGAGYQYTPIVSFVGGNSNITMSAQATATLLTDTYTVAGFVDDNATSVGTADVVSGVFPAFTPSQILTIPPTANMTVANSPTANIFFQPTAYSSLVFNQGNPYLTFALTFNRYSGTVQPQGSPDSDNSQIWYNIGTPYSFANITGTVYFNVVGYNPYIRLQFNVTGPNYPGAGGANILLINDYVPQILYR